MSKIQINKINENEIEVRLDNDVPFEMVENLSKSFAAKGLFQDNTKSSLGIRYFVREEFNDDIEDAHEQLMKSLESMIKADAHTKLKWEQARQSRLVDRNKRRESMGMAPISMEQFQNPAGKTPPAAPTAPSAPSARPNTLPGVANTVYNPATSGKVNYVKKDENGHTENDPKCTCAKCSAVRKAELNKSLRDKLGGNKWGQHNPFPSAYQPNTNKPLPTADEIMAGQLANMMMNKNMMQPRPGVPLLGSAVPPQPTDEQLFGHLVPSEEQLKKAERQWAGGMNDFFAEASKPISSRFNSEEEELAYWSKLKVSDRAGSVD